MIKASFLMMVFLLIVMPVISGCAKSITPTNTYTPTPTPTNTYGPISTQIPTLPFFPLVTRPPWVTPHPTPMKTLSGSLVLPIVDNPYRVGGEYFYKGAVHVHPEEDCLIEPYTGAKFDCDPNSREAVEAYEAKGYDFMFLTDHNSISPNQGVEGIIQIPALEDGEKHRHHLLALGIDFNRVWDYHNTVRSDVDEEPNGIVNWDTGDCANVYRRIEYYEYVGMAVLAHPHVDHSCWTSFCNGWSWNELRDNWTETVSEETKELHNYTGIEIYNAAETSDLSTAFCLDWWDELLCMGKRVWGFGGDDCHNVDNNYKSFNRSWIVVRSNLPESTNASTLQGDIVRNIKAGNFYTVVRGPEIPGSTSGDGPIDIGPELRISATRDGLINVDTDITSTVLFWIGTSTAMYVSERQNVEHSSYLVEGWETYIRVEVRQLRADGQLYYAYSQPLFVDGTISP